MIIKINDVVRDRDNFPCMIMEKCTQSLGNIIKNYKDELIPEKHILRIFAMTCIPLFHIHSKKIVHRDLKPDNILQKFVGDKELFIITDFGTSFIPKSGSVTTVKDSMSAFYASIEQLDLEEPHSSFDIWSSGIILYLLMAKKEPYTQFSIVKRQKAIKENQREKLAEIYS